MKYDLHPACAMWPPMSDCEIDDMAADIKAHGQTHPIILIGDKVLDGRNRALACEKVGIEPTTEAYTGDDPIDYVVSANLHRRHLSTSQRGAIGADIARLKHGGDRKSKQFQAANSRLDSQTEAAKLMDVSVRTIQGATSIRENGEPGMFEAVKAGKIAVGRGIPAKKAAKTALTRPSSTPAPQHKPLKLLTQEEVEPGFTGTPFEFTAKYGHTPIKTAEQYATERFGSWAYNLDTIRNAVHNGSSLGIVWPTVDLNWLRNPRPRDIAKMATALEYLRPKIAEAEALLQQARAAEEARRPAPHQPDALSLPSA